MRLVIFPCLISVYLTWIVAGSTRYRRQSDEMFCSSTISCPDKQCCRDSQGNIIGGDSDWSFLEPTGATGTCSRMKSGPREVCSLSCGCVEGYTCYRTVTGACCPPYTCWESGAAARDRKYWQNCRPPKCFFPM